MTLALIDENDLANEYAIASSHYRSCSLCPRACHVDRLQGETGVCGASEAVRIGRAALHFWEEPCLVGNAGSGAVFFSHCPLRCVYCQNAELAAGAGVPVDLKGLAAAMLRLQNSQGAANINLVTPTHYVPSIAAVLRVLRAPAASKIALDSEGQGVAESLVGEHAHLDGKPKGCGEGAAVPDGRDSWLLYIPVVYNTSSFDSVQALRLMRGLVDVFLADFKYAGSSTARALSKAPQYPETALAALEEMISQVGFWEEDEEGMLQRGVIVRHLVLPGHVDESIAALDALAQRFGTDLRLSIMNQYTPLETTARACNVREVGLDGSVSNEDYERVLDHADELGFGDYFWQEGGACEESFIPAFDGTGVVD